MARGKHRPNGAGRVDRNAFGLGREAFEKGMLPLPPSGNPVEMHDFNEGYEYEEYLKGYPSSQLTGPGV